VEPALVLIWLESFDGKDRSSLARVGLKLEATAMRVVSADAFGDMIAEDTRTNADNRKKPEAIGRNPASTALLSGWFTGCFFGLPPETVERNRQ